MFTMWNEDTKETEGVESSVYEGREATKRQLKVDVEKMTLTFSNLRVVQVGKSTKIVNEVEPRCSHRWESKQVKPETIEDEEKEATGSPTANEAGPEVSTLSVKDNSTLVAENKSRTEDIVGVEYGMPLIRKQGSLKGARCEAIMKKLEKLQDNGRFEAHEKLVCGLLRSYSRGEDQDMKAALMIERGIAFYYADDLRKCKQHFTAAIRMGKSLVNRELLEGRALFLKAATYRREKKLNKALRYLQQAEFLLFHHESGEDKAELFYNYGTLWLDMYSMSSNDRGRKTFRKEAKQCFKREIEYGVRDERLRVQLRKKRYYNLRIAALHLDCSSKAARKTHHVLDENVEEAKKRLDFVEDQLSDGIPLGTKVQLFLTRSDQHYRQGNPRLAREVAQEALDIAEKLENNSSIDSLRERIEELQAMEEVLPRNIEPVITRMRDSGWSGDCSSCSD